jgi:integrase
VINTAIKWRADQLNINPPTFVITEKAFDEAGRAEGLRKEDRDNSRDRRFDHGEEARLMATIDQIGGAAGEDWRLFVGLAIETGARLQELAWMEWREIDATGEWWHIPGKHSKTKSRAMSLTDEAMRIIARLRELRHPTSLRLFHSMHETKQISDDFAGIVRKAGLPDFRFHDLRHEGISRFVLTQIRLPIKVIMTMVGHSSLKMLDRYAKLRPNEMSHLIIRSSK